LGFFLFIILDDDYDDGCRLFGFIVVVRYFGINNLDEIE